MLLESIKTSNNFEQLGIVANRLRSKIDQFAVEIPHISVIGDVVFSNIDYTLSVQVINLIGDVVRDLHNALNSVFSTGYQVCNSDGKVISLKSYHTDITEETLLQYYPLDSSGNLIDNADNVLLDLNANSDLTVGQLVIYPQRFKSFEVTFNVSFNDFLAYYWGEASSEVSLWYDVVSSFLKGAWNNAGEFCSYIRDKLQSCTSGLLGQYEEIKAVVTSASSGDITGLAKALLTKLTLGASAVASLGTGSINITDDGKRWSITSLNRLVFGKIFGSLINFAGQVLMFAGGAALKVLGVTLSAISSLNDAADNAVESLGNIKVNTKGFLDAWYGDIVDFTVETNTISSLLDVNVIPCVIDQGVFKTLITFDDEDGTKVRFRSYQTALLNPAGKNDLIDVIQHTWNFTTDHTMHILSRSTETDVEIFYAYLTSWARANIISEDEFEDLSDNEKLDSFFLSQVLLGLLWFSTLKTNGTSIDEPYYIFPYLLGVPTTESEWLSLFSGTYNGSGAYIRPMPFGSIYGDVLVEMLLSGFSYTWTSLLTLRNAWVSFLYDSPGYTYWNTNPYNTRNYINIDPSIIGHGYFVKTIHFMESTSDQTYITSYVESVLSFGTSAYLIFDWNKDYYSNNCSEASNTISLCRYYMPQVEPTTIRSFINIMKIAIIATTIIVATVYVFKKVTRNKRQAKKYSDYNNAVDAYKENPTNENYKAMKRAQKSLAWDTKLYGNSKYLTTLSGAQFGWDSGDGNSVESQSLLPVDNANQKSDVTEGINAILVRLDGSHF